MEEVARACLENNSNYIDWFELDPEIVDACYRHLPKVCSKVKPFTVSRIFVIKRFIFEVFITIFYFIFLTIRMSHKVFITNRNLMLR